MSAAVEALVSPPNESFAAQPPAWAHPQNIRQIRMGIREAKGEPMERRERRQKFQMMEGQNILDLRGWWLQRMATTPAPLLEKMTLFWHGHFATSAEKVKDGYWLWRQNDTQRRGALGNFVSLTKAISRDPAMMIYLDLQQSRKEKPNENWARELMELFTLGIGNYSEQDIKESARAFTGYRIDMTTQQFRYAPFQFDAGPKTFLGQTGPLTGDNIIDIITKQPACSKFIARKLWRFSSKISRRNKSSTRWRSDCARTISKCAPSCAKFFLRTSSSSPVRCGIRSRVRCNSSCRRRSCSGRNYRRRKLRKMPCDKWDNLFSRRRM